MNSVNRRCRKTLALSLIALAATTHAAWSRDNVSTAAAPGEEKLPRMVAAARDYLHDYLHRQQPELSREEYELVSRVPAHTFKSDDTVAALSVRGGLLSRRMCVWLTLQRTDQTRATIPLWFSVKAYQPVFVALHTRSPRQRLRSADVTVEEHDIAPLSAAPLSGHADIDTLRARHVLSMNHVILRDDVEPLPPIVRGEDVAVQVRYGSVQIQTSALALQDGQLGRSVKLQNPTSNSTFMAQVIGDKKALVAEK